MKLSDFDINFPPWINYGKGDKKNKIGEKMDDLKRESWSPFNGCDSAQIFIFCMAYAVAKNRRAEKRPPGGRGSMPGSAFKRDMRDFMKAVAIAHTSDLDIITKPNEVVKIAENYAYAGFLEVYNKIQLGNQNHMSRENILNEFLHEVVEDKN